MAHTPWENDKIQFARLIYEAEGADAFDADSLRESVDLPAAGVSALVNRAIDYWETHSKPAMRPLESPLSREEAVKRSTAHTDPDTLNVTLSLGVVVVVTLAEMTNCMRKGSYERFLDLLAFRAVGGTDLVTITHEVVGHQGDDLLVYVTADLETEYVEDEPEE